MYDVGTRAVAILLVWLLTLTMVRAEVPSAGLLHWWPDPAEGTDAVTGRRGIQHGFGPIPSGPQARFGHAAGWVELGPGITNQTFTLTGWLQPWFLTFPEDTSIISQDSGLGDGWSIHQRFGEPPAVEFASHSSGDAPRSTLPWKSLFGWQAIALRITPTQSEVWVDGVAMRRENFGPSYVAVPGPLCVGNLVTGNLPWEGDLRDLRLFDRILTDEEIREIARQPRSEARATWPSASARPVSEVTLQPTKPRDYRLQHFTTDHGLPSAEIQCVFQASEGALWLGFEAGLVRFDGRRFQLMDASAPEFAATGPDVGAIAEGPARDLWLGLFRGLVRRGLNTWQVYTNLGPYRFVRCMLPNADGTVWTASFRDAPPRGQARLRHLDPKTGSLQVDVPFPGQILDLRPAKDGLWVSTEDPEALWHFDTVTSEITLAVQITGDATTEVGKLSKRPLVRVAETATRRGIRAEVWQEKSGPGQWVEVQLGDAGPVLSWSRQWPSLWRFGSVSAGASTPGWVGTPFGLLHRERNGWAKVKLGGQDAAVKFLSPNAEGGVWVVTESDGLWLVQPQPVKMLTREDGLPDDDIQSVVRLRSGEILCGAYQGLPVRIKPLEDTVGIVAGLCARNGLLSELRDGSIVQTAGSSFFHNQGGRLSMLSFGTGLGMVRLADSSQIHAAHDGTVWLVLGRGVYQARELPVETAGQAVLLSSPNQYSSWLHDLPPQDYLVGLAEAPNGSMWIGSSSLGLFHIEGGRVQHIPDPAQRTNNPCVPLGFGTDGTLWLGSEAGLGAFRNGTFHWIRADAGLPETVVVDVEEMDGHLWLAGRRGIHAIPRTELEAYFAGQVRQVHALSLGLTDGLQSTDIRLRLQPAMAQSDDGQLWVATARGVAHLKPAEVLASLRPPPVAIDELVATGRRISLHDPTHPARLAAGEGRVVEFQFSSLSFRAPERVTFECHLSGPGGEFAEETVQAHVTYRHLRPGRHVFTVAARSGNGLVSDPPARVEFILKPYLYETPWFLGAATLGGVSLVGS
ncbi:MAG TPA: hypothetical protein PLX89_27765, partial [Verrucomicrobiota bacterium]|nr:hypothetical protein [Verrucomicrobiales bacterium]HRI16807.1 hypothetical protein [Verrucomicrobiota bacterium]